MGVAADGAGGAFVVWSFNPDYDDSRIAAQRIVPAGAAWPVGGVQITPAELESELKAVRAELREVRARHP